MRHQSDEFKSFLVMDILEKASEMEQRGEEVIHLEVGQPDFPTPECVREAACKAICDGQTGYTHSLGLVKLREEIAAHYHAHYKVSLSPDQIIVTPGTSPAMLLTALALLNKGDKVLLTDPHYACYPNFIRIAGAEPVNVPVQEKDGFHFSMETIEGFAQSQAKAVLINSPSNPTGTVMEPERLEALCNTSLTILSDEIYHGLVYGQNREYSALNFTDNCFVFNGFSKLYAMTGWRLGYVIAPRHCIPFMQKLQQSFIISTGEAVQRAGIAALQHAQDDVARMKTIFNERREYILKRLKQIGFSIAVEPKGAFYVFVDASHLGKDSVALAFDILKKIKVGVTPGVDFGPGGEGYLRFSYANSMENIAQAMDRLENYIQKK